MPQGRADLDSLPVRGGFRLRGLEMTRLETFVDAAFAFAITLLIVAVGDVPGDYAELVAALKAAPSFLASFALIMFIWVGHRTWSRRFGLEDPVTTLLSLGLVFVMLVWVFPLRLMASALLSFLTGGFLPSEFRLTGISELPGLFIIYGLGHFLLSGILALLHVRAKAAEGLGLDAIERLRTDEEICGWLTMAFTGVVSALVAWIAPPRIGIWAGFVYTTLAVSMPWIAVHHERKVKRLQRAAPEESAEGRDATS
jgi:uncharacterized membrane protein